MVSLLSVHRRLCHCCDGVVAFIVMASLSSPMRRHLAVVDNDGVGMTGDDNDNDFNNATDLPSL